jgi:hypothetical protein
MPVLPQLPALDHSPLPTARLWQPSTQCAVTTERESVMTAEAMVMKVVAGKATAARVTVHATNNF